MAWKDSITGKPIKNCTCGTCIWKLMPGEYGISLTPGCSAFWLIEYDPDAFQIRPLSEMPDLAKIFSIKPNYNDEYLSLDIN
jgi:hypothetical protein